MPTAVGRYRIDRVLGSGAFASVWLGLDDDLNDQVAIKVLSGALLDDLDVRNRFLEEARILRRADSERLVRVHEFGELPDGRPYFVMSYADKGSLADRMGRRPLPVSEALALAEEISHGVEVINELGVIHRDLKPSNILFQTTKDGVGERLLIADLGLAKALAHASGAFTLPVGTPGYMSPEQARFGGGLDVRADVYGVGALTYHLLTGRAPGPAPVRVPPSQINPELTPVIDAVILKALESDREQRWPTAEAFAQALGAVRRGQVPPGLTVPQADPATSPDFARPNPSYEPYGRAAPPVVAAAAAPQPPQDDDRTAAYQAPVQDPEATYLDQRALLDPGAAGPAEQTQRFEPVNFDQPPAGQGSHQPPAGQGFNQPPAGQGFDQAQYGSPAQQYQTPVQPSGGGNAPAKGNRLLIPAVVTAGVLAIGVVAVVLVKLTGGGTAKPSAPPTPKIALVALSDASQKIMVSVPTGWTQDARATWVPSTNTTGALTDGQSRPVLRASTDPKTAAADRNAKIPSIFIGLTTDVKVPPATAADHTAAANGGCTKGTGRTKTIGTLTAQITPWTACKTGPPSITEVGLVDASKKFGAWVRIKQVDATDVSDTILGTIKLVAP
jgi:serine/threonine protein kinase